MSRRVHIFLQDKFSAEMSSKLNHWLTIAEKNSEPRWSLERLFSLFGYHHTPTGALLAQMQGIDTQQKNFLCAEWVSLSVDLAKVYFFDQRHIERTNFLNEKLRHELQTTLSAHGLTIISNDEQRLLLCCEQQPAVSFSLPEAVLGNDIFDFLPTGPDKKLWLQLFNELQMLLHQHQPLAVNALWFWGAGALPSMTRHHVKALCSGLDYVQALAMRHAVRTFSPEHFFEQCVSGESGDYVLAHSFETIVRQLPSLERALKKNQIASISLSFFDQSHFLIDAKHFKKWWQWR